MAYREGRGEVRENKRENNRKNQRRRDRNQRESAGKVNEKNKKWF